MRCSNRPEIVMVRIIVIFFVLLIATTGAAQDRSSEHAKKTFEIYKTIIEVDTSKHRGNTLRVAQYLADELIAAGLPAADVEVIPKDSFGALIARYRGDDSSGDKPILFLARSN